MRLQSIIVALFSVLAATACTSSNMKETAPQSAQPTDDSGADATTATDGSGPTWHRDVAPILSTQCARCHYDGGLGPADFTDLDTVRALAPAMVGAMEDRLMPPPASDPGCQDYSGSEHLVMSDEDRERFASWVAADMPEGDPTDAVPAEPVKDTLEDPDLVLMMDNPYLPAFTDPANPGNEYRCFVIDATELGGRNIRAMAPVLGANQMVHHIVLFSVPSSTLTEDMLAPGGWDCIDGQNVGTADGMISAWAPGMLPIEFPEGTGMHFEADHQLVVQMHYFYGGSSTDGTSDQSGYAFHLVPEGEPVTPVLLAPAGNFSFEIPAGAAEYTVEDTFENNYVPLKLLGVFPHMHDLGTWFNARIRHTDGSETCLVDGAYSFDNQMTYQFREPIVFDSGDVLDFSCTWDNSEGTEPVRWGERTNEEMCFFFTFLTL